MSLKIRLAFLYSLSVFTILLVSAFSIYFLNENFRKEEFAKRLVSEGIESIELFSGIPAPNRDIIADLNQNAANSLPKEEISIFDSAQNILFSTKSNVKSHISNALFDAASSKRDYFFTANKRQSVLLYRIQKGKQFYVLASAYDTFGLRKGDNLKILLTSSVIGGLLLSGFLAFFYVRHAMNPLEKLKRQIEKIDEKNLKERIPVGKKDDEVWQIAKKFNAMLDRLQQAFEQRKNFVHHASHELRTPLANMLSQTESALNKKLSAEEYRNILISLKEDQQDMIDLTNSLLTLSRYQKISGAVDIFPLRIDEVLYEAADFVRQIWPQAIVTIDFISIPSNENNLLFKANESLIKAAVHNLIKNAITYSANGRVQVSILANSEGITLHFDNQGKQLSAEEQSKLFIPFFRGENSFNKKGYGLGLSIVQRIINVHNGAIYYNALADNTNRFTIYLPATAN